MLCWIQFLVLLLSTSYSLQCSQEGYKEYVSLYPFKLEYSNQQAALNEYLTNCFTLQSYQSIDKQSDITAFLDWSDSELLQLGKLNVCNPTEKLSNQSINVSKPQFSLSRSTHSFDDLSFAYFFQSSICSTSWATSVIEIAEAAVDHRFEFSANQLLQCLPVDTKCEGVAPEMLTRYLNEVGLVRKEDFTDCESVKNQATFTFEPVLPVISSKSGLMNLVAEGKPVFVMVGVDMLELRYVKDMHSSSKPLVPTHEHSLYGIVSGYNTVADTPYWEIVSHVIPAEEVILRISTSDDEREWMASSAFSLKWKNDEHSYECDESEYPTIDSIPADATELIFKAGSYQTLVEADFSRFVQLKRVVFGDHSFTSCHGVIFNNPFLTSIVFGDGFLSLPKGTSVEGRRLRCSIPGLFITAPELENLVVKRDSVNNMNEVVIEGLSGNVTVSVNGGAFTNVNVITTSNESRLFAGNLKEAIEEVNPDKNIEIVVPIEEPSLSVEPFVVIPARESDESKLTSETFASYFAERLIDMNYIEVLAIFSTRLDPSSIVDLSMLPKLEKVIFVMDDSNENNMINMNNLMMVATCAFDILSVDEFNQLNTPTEAPSTPTPTPTPTPEPWYAIYDPFILGDNSNYYDPENFLSDTQVLQAYLAVRDAYPDKALKNTRVLALMGMTENTIALFDASLAAQTEPADNPIDCYFYGDSLKPRYILDKEVIPLLQLTRFTRSKRIVFANGAIMREGMEQMLKFMSEHKEYYQNLEHFEISRAKLHAHSKTTTEEQLETITDNIIAYLQEMCNETNYPKLVNITLNNNGYNEDNNHIFQDRIKAACHKVKAVENDNNRNAFPKMCAGSDLPRLESYTYYDLSAESTIVRNETETLPVFTEKNQCRFTWNWEFMDEFSQYSEGPYNAPEQLPVVPTQAIPPMPVKTEVPTSDSLHIPLKIDFEANVIYNNAELIDLIQSAINNAGSTIDTNTIIIDTQYLDCMSNIYDFSTINGISDTTTIIIDNPLCIIDTTATITYVDNVNDYFATITGALVISIEEQCAELNNKQYKSIVVKEGLCKTLTYDLFLSDFPYLESLTIERNALSELNSLVISNNSLLTTINITNSIYNRGALNNVPLVEISSIHTRSITSRSS